MLKKSGTAIDMLEDILSGDNKLASYLIRELGETEALRIGRDAARTTTNPAHRKKYVKACVQIYKRIAELEAWLAKHPPLEDILDVDEIRALPKDTIRERHRERRKCEEEIAALRGEGCGYDKLIARVGPKCAMAMYLPLADCFFRPDGPASSRRVNTILLKASQADFPRAYVESCIESERVARLAKRKKRRRNPAKPKPREKG
jgi:hypothetical protein